MAGNCEARLLTVRSISYPAAPVPDRTMPITLESFRCMRPCYTRVNGRSVCSRHLAATTRRLVNGTRPFWDSPTGDGVGTFVGPIHRPGRGNNHRQMNGQFGRVLPPPPPPDGQPHIIDLTNASGDDMPDNQQIGAHAQKIVFRLADQSLWGRADVPPGFEDGQPDTCSICIEPYTPDRPVILLDCAHTFCVDCLADYIICNATTTWKYSGADSCTCPLCRHAISDCVWDFREHLLTERVWPGRIPDTWAYWMVDGMQRGDYALYDGKCVGHTTDGDPIYGDWTLSSGSQRVNEPTQSDGTSGVPYTPQASADTAGTAIPDSVDREEVVHTTPASVLRPRALFTTPLTTTHQPIVDDSRGHIENNPPPVIEQFAPVFRSNVASIHNPLVNSLVGVRSNGSNRVVAEITMNLDYFMNQLRESDVNMGSTNATADGMGIAYTTVQSRPTPAVPGEPVVSQRNITLTFPVDGLLQLMSRYEIPRP